MAVPGADRVVILGRHSADWMTALDPKAPVWRLLPQIVEVQHVDSPTDLPSVVDLPGTVVLPLLESHIAACPTTVRALVPPAVALATLWDKSLFARYMVRRGWGALLPRHFDPGRVSYPCVIKRTDLFGGIGVVVASSPRELSWLLRSDTFCAQPVVLQELMWFDEEFATTFVADRGRICTWASYRHAGGKVTAVPTPSAVKRPLCRLARALRFNGPANADWCRDHDGRIRFFEVNPRLAGSLMRPDQTHRLSRALLAIVTHAPLHAAATAR